MKYSGSVDSRPRLDIKSKCSECIASALATAISSVVCPNTISALRKFSSRSEGCKCKGVRLPEIILLANPLHLVMILLLSGGLRRNIQGSRGNAAISKITHGRADKLLHSVIPMPPIPGCAQ